MNVKQLFITNNKPVPDVTNNDFIGSVRSAVQPELVDQAVPGEYIDYILYTPKKFGWNTLTVAALQGPVTTSCTNSSPQEVLSGSAIWINLADCPNASSNLPSDGVVPSATTIMYAWEHPIVAFKFEAESLFKVEMTSKHD